MASLEYIKVRNNMSYTIIPLLMKKTSEKRVWLTEEKKIMSFIMTLSLSRAFLST